MEAELISLVVSDADTAVTVSDFPEKLQCLLEKADLGERRRFRTPTLEAVYVDTVEEKRTVAIRPGPTFRTLLEIATTGEGADIILAHDRKEDGCIGYSNVKD